MVGLARQNPFQWVGRDLEDSVDSIKPLRKSVASTQSCSPFSLNRSTVSYCPVGLNLPRIVRASHAIITPGKRPKSVPRKALPPPRTILLKDRRIPENLLLDRLY